MPEENRTLLRKAELAVSDFTTNGGVLQPAQANKFIRLAIKEPVLLKQITVTPMKSLKEERDKLRFAGRVLKPGQEATALPSASWAKPNLGMFTLDAQLFKAEARMSDEVLEDQIERGQFQQTIMQELSKAIGRDMEYVAINGDTASADPLLAKLDGVLKQITSNTVNHASAKMNKGLLRDMLRTMPDEFANDMLVYHTNRQARIDYKDSLADRATGLGDLMLETGNRPVVYNDYPVVSVPEFPVAAGDTQAILGNPKGIHLGIWRQIRVKVDEDISAGVVIIVATVRFDVKVAEESAYVRAYAVKGS